ncbi:MAG: glycosyltransferase family 4 protein, partial [Nitrospinales bacterium]
SGYLNELKKLCEDLGIKRHVTFAGAQSPEAVKTCYRNADVFVYPSLYENFGQPILEAAAAGLAIISTNVGIAKEIIRDGENGFIVDGDPEVIKDRMEALAALQSRTTFGKRIQEKVRKDLAWDRIIQRYAEIYRSL